MNEDELTRFHSKNIQSEVNKKCATCIICILIVAVTIFIKF